MLSTSLSDDALLVLCRCGQFGTVEVEQQTPEERQAAVQEARQPYPWVDNHRVTLRFRIAPEVAQARLPPEGAV